ncbi:MAG: hypothetical protein LBT46_00070 [Planctomycetaceae bacterium]|jgi:hypothetical protein|nr:hypothetical protein [Planctomycetaceae bacterium]
MPIRFFCNTCRQLLKIGHSQSGTLIVCPKCKDNIGVPFQSHPQAEALYQFIKRKKTEWEFAETTKKQPLLLHRARRSAAGTTPSYENLDLYLKDAIRATQDKSGNVPAPSVSLTLEESTERWMDEFWKDNTWKPEQPLVVGGKTAAKESKPVSAATPSAKADRPAEHSPLPEQAILPAQALLDEEDAAVMIVRQRLQIKSLKILAATAFVIGLSLGLCLPVLITKREHFNVPGANLPAGGNVLNGTLHYKNANGDKQPDTGAAVFFIPADAKPLVPISTKGLLPGEKMNDESVRSIEELGGKCFQCNAAGAYVFEYKANKRYYVLFVSAHSERTGSVPPDAERKLRKFFSNPSELLGNYNFLLEEYDWQEGKYIFPLTL